MQRGAVKLGIPVNDHNPISRLENSILLQFPWYKVCVMSNSLQSHVWVELVIVWRFHRERAGWDVGDISIMQPGLGPGPLEEYKHLRMKKDERLELLLVRTKAKIIRQSQQGQALVVCCMCERAAPDNAQTCFWPSLTVFSCSHTAKTKALSDMCQCF